MLRLRKAWGSLALSVLGDSGRRLSLRPSKKKGRKTKGGADLQNDHSVRAKRPLFSNNSRSSGKRPMQGNTRNREKAPRGSLTAGAACVFCVPGPGHCAAAFGSRGKWVETVFTFLCLTYFTYPSTYPRCHKWSDHIHFLLVSSVLLYMYLPHPWVHSTIDGNLGQCHNTLIVNNASVNVKVPVFSNYCFCFLQIYLPRSGIAGSHGSSTFNS